MCFILATSKLTARHIDILGDAWVSNSDGSGICAYTDRLLLIKPLMKLPHLLQNAEKLIGNPCVIHLRQATHGAVNGSNCHPFWTCHKKVLMAHNGIMPQPWASDRQISDSRRFAESLMHMTLEEVQRSALQLEHQIGGWNKVVFMDELGQVFILNPEAGHQYDDDTWCSTNPDFFWYRAHGSSGYGSYGPASSMHYDVALKRWVNDGSLSGREARKEAYQRWWENRTGRQGEFPELTGEEDERLERELKEHMEAEQRLLDDYGTSYSG